jgi:hypothetical protein
LVDVRDIDAALTDERVGPHAQSLDDVVLEQSVRDEDVRPEELVAAGHLLEEGDSVVDDELEVEVRDAHAGVALARRGLTDVPATPSEPEVAALDGVEQRRAVDPLRGHVREGSVPLELGQPEARAQGRDDGADEVGQDVLRVLDLDVGEVPGVARDVSDEQARRSGFAWHRSPMRPIRPGPSRSSW